MRVVDNMLQKPCPCDEVKEVVIKSDTTRSTNPRVDSSLNKPVRIYPLKSDKSNYAHKKNVIVQDSITKKSPYVTDQNVSVTDSSYNSAFSGCNYITIYENWNADSTVFVKDSIRGERLQQIIKAFPKIVTNKILGHTIKYRPSVYLGAGAFFALDPNPFFSATFVTRKNTYAVLANPLSKQYGVQIQFKLF